MKFLIVLAAFVAVATCWSIPSKTELASQWQKFKATHGKNYASAEEETHRMQIFKENAIKIAKHNARYEAGEVTFTLGVNKYADLLNHEFVKMFNGYRSGFKPGNRTVHKVSDVKSLLWPWNKKVDWRTKGFVTPVKDQGTCGSCWAFSTTGAMEGQWYAKTGRLVSMSEQNLIDCATGHYHNHGCGGGNIASSFDYIKDKGIESEESYPYEDKQGKCRYQKSNVSAIVHGHVDIEVGSESALADAVKNIGPIAAGIDASWASMQFYKSGIYYEPRCSTTILDHAVLVVGYGSNGKNKDYWIVKNSWGTEWGEKGYLRMARNKNNNCGIASDSHYPLI